MRQLRQRERRLDEVVVVQRDVVGHLGGQVAAAPISKHARLMRSSNRNHARCSRHFASNQRYVLRTTVIKG
jgi:hypothetical protein